MGTAVDTRVRLTPTGRGAMAMGGTCSWVVEVDGRRVGWVGDARVWHGSRHGARTWWACWREDGDQHARWNSDSLRTRTAAVEALVARAGER